MILSPPNETQLKFVKKQHFYQPAERLEEDVTQLIEWLSKQPHLPNVTDRKWLTHFIIGCKYNLQRSKQVIESYFIARAELPEFFYHEDGSKNWILEGSKFGTISIFPKLTPECDRIVCIRTKPIADGNDFDAMVFNRWIIGLMDLQLKQEPLYGQIYLYDLKHVQLSQLLTYTPTVTKNVFKCCIDAFPLRLKSVQLVNAPKFVGRFIEFFKMFLSEKLKQRIIVNNTLDDLYKNIPKENLPDIYGGTGGNMDKIEDDSFKYQMANTEWLDSRLKADLSKRPSQTKTEELNMNGTFRKLQID